MSDSPFGDIFGDLFGGGYSRNTNADRIAERAHFIKVERDIISRHPAEALRIGQAKSKAGRLRDGSDAGEAKARYLEAIRERATLRFAKDNNLLHRDDYARMVPAVNEKIGRIQMELAAHGVKVKPVSR